MAVVTYTGTAALTTADSAGSGVVRLAAPAVTSMPWPDGDLAGVPPVRGLAADYGAPSPDYDHVERRAEGWARSLRRGAQRARERAGTKNFRRPS